jgi:hypothetical protein
MVASGTAFLFAGAGPRSRCGERVTKQQRLALQRCSSLSDVTVRVVAVQVAMKAVSSGQVYGGTGGAAGRADCGGG